jgi:GMP synthase-like glutamine amidotransferase
MSGADRESLRALVIQHEEPTPGGYVHEWLNELGAEQDVYRIDLGQRDIEPRDYSLIVSLGSEFPAFDDSIEWIGQEMELFRRATGDDVPILGICFGGQLLARTLGGRCFRGEPEIGWLPIASQDSSLVPEGPWFQWHFDTFTLPPGAEQIADSAAGPQAYRIGRSLGVQFHPEVTPQIMDEWVAVYRHELDQEGVDPDGILEETHRRAEEHRATAWRLFDGFLDQIAGVKEVVRGR